MTHERLPDKSPITAGNNGRAGERGTVVALRDDASGVDRLIPSDRSTTIGKDPSSELVLDDPCVSRRHCVLEWRGPALYARDLGSRNGTFVDDRRIECAELTPGAVLVVGGTRLVALGASRPTRSTAYARLIGLDPSFRQAVELARRAASTDCSVLILGETGTGKELIAQCIHEGSRRARLPFVAVNCGAIPRELIGSELFGHERGAFTGAMNERDGVFVQADRGTLFLDELGELPLSLQPHLLRALETRQVRRLGSGVDRTVDVRVLAATHRLHDLGTERGSVRVDLYHRLATLLIMLPPLRNRVVDLDPLCDAFLEEFAVEHGRRTLSDAARVAIREHRWPGNVRELRQALTRAVTVAGTVIEPEHLFPVLPDRAVAMPPPVTTPGLPPLPPGLELAPYEALVRETLHRALVKHGSIRAAANALGIAKSTFADKARRYGLLAPTRGRR
ncbi:MAG TPA: sigma 54-interacting transcriptional regulator [Kofleriaceae bacterium]|nr:sigma 54-interacting transcriptional regulator [Kofleriaceae bacterium]